MLVSTSLLFSSQQPPSWSQAQHSIRRNNTNLLFTHIPVYLGITLDIALSYILHLDKVKKKIAPSPKLLEKRSLTNSIREVDQHTLKQRAVALCYSLAEYGKLVWARSCLTTRLSTSGLTELVESSLESFK